MAISDPNQLADQHSFYEEVVFKVKTNGLALKRAVENFYSGVKKHQHKDRLLKDPVIAFSESELWNPNDNKDNWVLTAGKVQNLRIAARKLHGLKIPAGEVFSFWKQIGNPNIGKGYVVGREIREGCIVPTIAGGLCQLSNALYDTALKANFEIIERHQHTKVIKGSLAEQNRDATVKWNYIDLRFRSQYDFRIEVELTSDKLIVAFKSKTKETPKASTTTLQQSHALNDCYSCGNTACFKHPNKSGKKQAISNTTYILDEKWPEYNQYLQDQSREGDVVIVPLKQNPIVRTQRYNWSVQSGQKLKSTTRLGVKRALQMRLAPRRGQNIFQLSLHADQAIAQNIARQIPVESTHLVIAQNLLPYLYEMGVLGGRTYDVLMTRLPAQLLQENLDLAFEKHPESSTLRDFRVSQSFINSENTALTKARKIVTPHREIAKVFNNKSLLLDWYLPDVKTIEKSATVKRVLFPASAVGRKGAYEMKQLQKDLDFEILVLGRSIEKEGFWEGNAPSYFDGDFSKIDAIIYPTYVEHQPRILLKALAMGIPVITTKAAGLPNHEKLTIIELNSYENMKQSIQKTLHL